MLKKVLQDLREQALERLLRADDTDLAARRAAVLTLDHFAETLNGRIKRATGDGGAND